MNKATETLSEACLFEENATLKRLLQHCLQRIVEEEAVGKVFHDFNNILSSSMGYSSLALGLAKNSGDEKLSRYLDNIERAGIRARDLVRERLVARQELRNSQVVSWSALQRIIALPLSSAHAAADVYASEDQLVCAFQLLVRRIAADAACDDSDVALQINDEPHCEGCGSELRGRQVRLEWHLAEKASGEKNPHYQQDIALSSAIICSTGGHFCDSLVQDKQFVVYLRAVVPESPMNANNS